MADTTPINPIVPPQGPGPHSPSGHPLPSPPFPAPGTAKAVAAKYQAQPMPAYKPYVLPPLTTTGYCTLKLFGRKRVVIGGPFEAYHGGGISVCLEAHARNVGKADILIDVQDFQPPTEMQLIASLARLLDFARQYPRQPIYVGCRAGIGRTGTFIAAIARMADKDDPVQWTRDNYYGWAVETKAQERLVNTFSKTAVQHEYLRLRGKRPGIIGLIARITLYFRQTA